jgi:hypothetical protein
VAKNNISLGHQIQMKDKEATGIKLLATNVKRASHALAERK